MFKTLALLVLLILVCANAWARDPFEGIKCGADIPKSLVGRYDATGPVSALEARHKDLGLKNLGGTEISDRLFLASWQVCGSEYELLVNTKSGLIRDVIPFPQHSKSSPQFVGKCQANGKEIPASIVAVLDNSAGSDAKDEKLANTMLKATGAWKIDESKEKFNKQATENLACPLGAVATVDGGP